MRLRDVLLFLGLFLVVFGATVWLLAGGDGLFGLGGTNPVDESARETPAIGGPTAVYPPNSSQGAGATTENAANAATTAAGATVGHIAASLTADVGLIGTVNATLTPSAGRLSDNRSGTFRLEDIPPGTYRMMVWADGFLPQREHLVVVEAGKTLQLDLQLVAGVRPRGRTVDAENNTPVPGATIQFVGHMHVTSDHNGEFEAPWAIPAIALENMVISHPEYDTIEMLRHPWGDARNMMLGLGRGPCAMIGRITQIGPRALPPQARIRAFMTSPEGRQELRRQITVDTAKEFTIVRMTAGSYAMVLDFPGTNLPSRTELAHLGSPQPVEVVFPFGGGTKLEGTLLARAGAPLPTRVELIGEDGRSVLEVTSAAGGVFLMEAAPAGTWRLRVHYGNPHFNTEHFEIDEGQPVVLLEVDCDTQRLKR